MTHTALSPSAQSSSTAPASGQSAGDFSVPGGFASRHIGPSSEAAATMLQALGYDSLSDLVDDAVPASIRQDHALDLPAAMSEAEALQALRDYARRNTVMTQMIGQGFSATHTPQVILRNVLELSLIHI